MTDQRMALIALMGKGAETALVREFLAFAADRLMALEIQGHTGARAGVRTPDRINHRNGCRQRTWNTRVGRIDWAVPKLRRAPTSHPFSSRGAARPRRRSQS